MSSASSENSKLLTHPFWALSIILVLIAILSNVIPSGTYDRIVVDGRTLVDPATFKFVAKKYSGISDFFLSFYYGFQKASGLIAMVLFVGGAFGVVNRVGLMEVAIKSLSNKLRNLGFLPFAAILMTLIGLQVTISGLWELSLVLLPFVVPLCLSLGYNTMSGVAIVVVGSCCGFGAAFTNPFFTAIAHQIAELPLYSGLWYRAISFVLFLTASIIYIVRYERRVKADPSVSVLQGIPEKYSATPSNEDVRFTPALVRAGIVFLALFGFLVYGTVAKGFAFAEMSAIFVAMGVCVGFVAGKRLNEVCYMFADGMRDLLMAGLVIFFARAILYIMEQTLVIDTVIYFLASLTEGTSTLVSAAVLYIVQSLINFIIPSGSGQAAITLPIFIPVGDIAGLTRQVVCYASQLGDGLSNFIYPTNGALIAILAVAGVPYARWIKYFGPLFAILATMGLILVVIAQAIELGPF